MKARKKPLEYSVAVVGGGASGMLAAIGAARIVGSDKVVLLEKNPELGKKILATGNGRCNLTNVNSSADYYVPRFYQGGGGNCDSSGSLVKYEYNPDKKQFISECLGAFDQFKTLQFFEEAGLWCKEADEEGRIYPAADQASDVRDILARELLRAGVHVIQDFKIDKIKQIEEGQAADNCERNTQEKPRKRVKFRLLAGDKTSVLAKTCVLATGGKAGLQYGSDGDGYGFAKSFGHSLEPPRPALVQVEMPDTFKKLLEPAKGVRVKGSVSLLKNGIPLATEKGEIQFTRDGLSGICIFNLSNYLDDLRNEREKAGPEYCIEIRLFTKEKALLEEALGNRQQYLKDLSTERFLHGMVHRKLADIYMKLWSLMDGSFKVEKAKAVKEKDLKIKDLTDTDIANLADLLTGLKVPIVKTKGWKEAQVTAGGVKLEEVEPVTMESRLTEGLYLAGELLDVAGLCGGFNLQWAFTSGYLAGAAAGKASAADRKETVAREEVAAD